MKAEVKRMYDNDTIQDLEAYKPENDLDFGLFLRLMVGPEGVEGSESFDVIVCTPDWFKSNMEENIQSGRHYLFMKKYDYRELKQFVKNVVSSFSGENWHEIGQKIGRFGKWEFEDYKEYKESAS